VVFVTYFFFTFTGLGPQRKILSGTYILCYLIQDIQTWCSSTSWDHAVSHTTNTCKYM